MIQVMEEEVVQRGDAVVVLHEASIRARQVRVVSLKLTQNP